MEHKIVSTTLPLLITILLTCAQNSTLAQADLVTKTCKQTPHFQLCLSILRSDPRSSTTDTTGLGLIMVDALKARTRAVLGRIKKLSGPNKGPLRDCADMYYAVLNGDLPKAVEALTKGDPKFAEDGVVDAGMEASYCEDGFERSKSPLSDMNKGIGDLAAVARAIIRMLL